MTKSHALRDSPPISCTLLSKPHSVICEHTFHVLGIAGKHSNDRVYGGSGGREQRFGQDHVAWPVSWDPRWDLGLGGCVGHRSSMLSPRQGLIGRMQGLSHELVIGREAVAVLCRSPLRFLFALLVVVTTDAIRVNLYSGGYSIDCELSVVDLEMQVMTVPVAVCGATGGRVGHVSRVVPACRITV